MVQQAKMTTDPKVIRRWADARRGSPAMVAQNADDYTELRIRFPDDRASEVGREAMRPITWEEFCKRFKSERLAFMFQDKTSTGELSRFCKFL